MKFFFTALISICVVFLLCIVIFGGKGSKVIEDATFIGVFNLESDEPYYTFGAPNGGFLDCYQVEPEIFKTYDLMSGEFEGAVFDLEYVVNENDEIVLTDLIFVRHSDD